MRWRLICLVLMASSICGSDQVRSTKISVSFLQSSMVMGMSWSKAAWVLLFHWGKHELQHVLWNTAAEHDPLPPETGSQGSVPAWQWLQTHLQDNHCFTEEAEGKTGQACLLTWTQKNIFGGSSSGRWRCAKSQISASSVTSSWRSGRAFQWLPVKLW